MSKKNETLKEILDVILYENPSTHEEIADRLGITRRYVTQLLKPLIEDGTVRRGYMIDLKSYENFAESLGNNMDTEDATGNILINEMLKNMGNHVHNQLEVSFNALLEYNDKKAQEALEMDYTTNNMVEKIRTLVETIANVNHNSEFSKSILYNEVAYDLERIGDYCCHIAKFVIEDEYGVDESLVDYLRKMYKKSKKMLRSSMVAFLEGKSQLKDEIMDMEESLHILQSKALNLLATQMAENSFDEKERSNYFIYIFRVIKAFERIGDISIEIVDIAIEFHQNIPRPTTPRTFRQSS